MMTAHWMSGAPWDLLKKNTKIVIYNGIAFQSGSLLFTTEGPRICTERDTFTVWPSEFRWAHHPSSGPEHLAVRRVQLLHQLHKSTVPSEVEIESHFYAHEKYVGVYWSWHWTVNLKGDVHIADKTENVTVDIIGCSQVGEISFRSRPNEAPIEELNKLLRALDVQIKHFGLLSALPWHTPKGK